MKKQRQDYNDREKAKTENEAESEEEDQEEEEEEEGLGSKKASHEAETEKAEDEEEAEEAEDEEEAEEAEDEEEDEEAKDEAAQEAEITSSEDADSDWPEDGLEEQEEEEESSEDDACENGEEEEPNNEGKITPRVHFKEETAMVPVSPSLADAGHATAEMGQKVMVRNSKTHKKDRGTLMRQVANRSLFPTQLAPHFLKSKQDLFGAWLDCGRDWDKVVLAVERRQETLNLSRSEMSAVKAKDVKKTMSKEKFDTLWASRKATGLFYVDRDFPEDEEDWTQTGRVN